MGQKSICEAGVRYLKSILVGAAAFVLAAILINVISYVMMRLHPPQMPDAAATSISSPASTNSRDSFEVNTNWVEHAIPIWPALLAGVAAFAGGFYWMLRRSTTRGAAPLER